MEIRPVAEMRNFQPDKQGKFEFCKGQHLGANVWSMEPGQRIEPHEHEGDHLWVVTEGTGFFLTDKGEYPVEPGHVVFAPQGEPHGMRATTRLVFVSVSGGA